MPLICSVNNCRMRAGDKGCSFHQFPRDPKLCREWCKVIGRKGFIPTIYSKICSRHFTKEDFDGIWIKKDSIPSIFDFDEPESVAKKPRRTTGMNVPCRYPLLPPQEFSPNTESTSSAESQPGMRIETVSSGDKAHTSSAQNDDASRQDADDPTTGDISHAKECGTLDSTFDKPDAPAEDDNQQLSYRSVNLKNQWRALTKIKMAEKQGYMPRRAQRTPTRWHILKSPAVKADDCSSFAQHVATKLKEYDSRTKAIAEHHINNILFQADMGYFDTTTRLSVPSTRSAYHNNNPLYMLP